jgi:L-ascorbate metabolism protein UlaG (beta-lactamase superfamily)
MLLPIKSTLTRPNPAEWSDNRITAAWLGHATVLINFFGIKILTDPVLFPRTDSNRRIAFNEQGIFRHYPELDG